MGEPPRTVLEFFAGIGLMRLGLEQAGWRVVYANDIDAKKHGMYADHFGADASFYLGDVHGIDAAKLPAAALATASFPCNDLSLAGARRGLAGSQSSAFWGFVEVLNQLGDRRPPLVLLENVTGFLTSNDGQDLRDALLALNELGYATDAFIIDAAHFVPQSRQRLFVLGAREPADVGRGTARGDARMPGGLVVSPGRPAALADFIARHPEVAWRLCLLPVLPRRANTLSDILEDLPLNSPQWWSPERADYLLGQMSPRHRAEAEAMIAGAGTRHGAVFRRVRSGRSMAELRTDGVAGCLRTPRGGSGRQILFAAGEGRFAVRLLTPRECARLMGADDFQLTVPANQALFGFGDAVCVPVVRWIADNYLTPWWQQRFAPAELGDALCLQGTQPYA